LPENYTGPGVFKRFLIGALIIVSASASATAVASFREIDKVVKVFTESPNKITDLEGVIEEAEAGKPQTILLMGSDKRSRRASDVRRGLIGKPRSDTMILVRLDPSKRAIALLSLPRDLKVEIPGFGTNKLNAAFELGRARLTIRTIRGLDPRLKINHVVNVDFRGFAKAVNALGCVYADVDRRYYNQSEVYAKIDIKPGYQRLCGQDSLDYVRYRLEDNDLVRAARQQDFLRQVKQQVGARRLFEDRDKLLRVFRRYMSSDISSRDGVLNLLKLVVASAVHPIREVHFRGKVGESYVTARESVMAKTVDDFLGLKESAGPRGRLLPKRRSERRRARRQDSGLQDVTAVGKDVALQAVNQRVKVFPVYYPTRATRGALLLQPPTVYNIETRDRRRFPSYRMVIRKGLIGEYYGLQGTTWMDPPILDDPSEKRRIRGRTFEIHYDGDRVRLVAWRSKKAVYWISNTLLQTLSERQMLSIAASTKPLG